MASTSNATQTVLFLAANPGELTQEQLAQEVEAIAQGLQQLPRLHPFQFEQRFVARPQEMMRAILDLSPQVVHFVGGKAGTAGIVLAERLFSLVEDQVQCVVLSRCYGQAQGEAIAHHIPFVVGMPPQLECEMAVEFAVNFYNMLESGRAIELAYKFGCSALQMAGVSEAMTPMLFKPGSHPPTPGEAAAPPNHPPQPASIPEEKPVSVNNSFNISGSTITNVAAGNISYTNEISQRDTQFPAPTATSSPEVPAWPTPGPLPSPPGTGGQTRQVEVFFSYSHRDEALRDEMAKHLSILKRQGVIKAWHDRDIGAGTEWATEIDDHLNSAQIILLLISPDFMASDYCFDIEMQRAMERHEAGEALVVPVILRPVDWRGAPFGKLQAFPKDAKPVTSWPNQDEAFLNVAQGIRRAVEKLIQRYS